MKAFHEIDCSIELKNKLEIDHYNTTRDFFEKRGCSESNIRSVKSFYESYDECKEEIIQKIMTSQGSVEMAEAFSTARACEIVDGAAKDHKKSNPKDNESKPRNWKVTGG